VLPLLDDLRKSGVLIAIGSASRNTPLILEKIGLADAFDAVVDGNAISNSKPHPEVFLKGAEALSVPPAECVVFEDAQAGVDAASAAGMAVIGVGNAGLNGADAVLLDLAKASYESIAALLQH
jgi:beta-phosphoglucomutase